MITISLIVPVYNPPLDRFRLCLKSLADQIYKDFEVILVDDGGWEDYEYVVNEYASLLPHLKILHQDHKGVSAARNNGIRSAQGEYIAFCDSDDFVEDNYLYSMAKAIPGFDLVICGIAEQFFPVNESKVNKSIFASLPSRYNWLQYTNFCWNKLFKKEIIINNNIFFDENIKLGEDALFLNQYFSCCNRIRLLSANLYHYMPNLNSATHSYKYEFWDWEQLVIDAQYKFFTQYGLNEFEVKFMQRWLYIKLKVAINYYLDNEIDKRKLHNRLSQIVSNLYFPKLYAMTDYNHNELFNRKDRVFLWLWSKLGIKGIKIGRFLKRLKG